MIRWMRFVLLTDFVHFLAVGWVVADDLAGTHHGAWSILMEWQGEGEPC